MAEITVPKGIIRPSVRLAGDAATAFAIIGRTAAALRRAGNSAEVIEAYRQQAMGGDYDHLLRVTLAFTEGAER